MNRSMAATSPAITPIASGVAGWTHPAVAQWIAGLSRVPTLLASRPAAEA
jgi:hypothetical protein